MTKQQLQYVDKVLSRIKEPDEHIAKARSYIQKDLAEYAAQRSIKRSIRI